MFQKPLKLIAIYSYFISMSEKDHNSTQRKIPALIDKYGLPPDITDRMASLWNRESSKERMSLEEITAFFNSHVFYSVLEETDIEIYGSEFDGVPDLSREIGWVKTEEPTDSEVISFQAKLEEQGIDFEELRNDLPSQSTIYRYLRDIKGVEYEKSKINKEDVQEILENQRGRTQQFLQSLVDRTTDDSLEGQWDVRIQHSIVCETCGERKSLAEFFTDSSCKCGTQKPDQDTGETP